ncbi:MAG TPA: magnesium chelatase [Phycisphaerae bacterium]|nr:magnesium chelatase [Phycisphaerae bacterium]HRW52237.1 magnesium chelatase [Phycisphaerae bacterium]
MTTTQAPTKPQTLGELRASGWKSRSVKQELHDNLLRKLASGEELFPGIIGYDNTVIPEICLAILSKHDMLFMGEKGQAKSRLMRGLVRLLDPEIPYVAGCELHDDPFAPITREARRVISAEGDATPIAWWKREDRYAERLSPGTKFADVIGEIDPAKLAAGTSMSTEEALHFGLIPRMHRGVFAMNEVPELDELVQVGLFNILEERDVQIRGFPIRFDLDVVILFSANPSTYNRSGKVIPQLKDRIGSLIRTHYPVERETGIAIMEQEADIDLDGEFPVRVPLFMKEICEQITIEARKSDFIDIQSGVSARFSISNYRTMIASARRRAAILGESHAIPRISDLAHIVSSSMGKLELDLMSSHQMSEQQIIDAVIVAAIRKVFDEYCDRHGFEEIADIFGKGVTIEVGDLLPSSAYEERMSRVPPAWEKAFEINPSQDPAMRACCVEFVLAGLYANEKISRTTRHGRVEYET